MLSLNYEDHHFSSHILQLLYSQNYSTGFPRKANNQLKLKGGFKKNTSKSNVEKY